MFRSSQTLCVQLPFKNIRRPCDDLVWSGTPSGSCCCFAVSPDVSYCGVMTILCLKQSVHLRFAKHVARSNSVPVILADHFMASIKKQCKRNGADFGGGDTVGFSWQCSPEHRWFLHDNAPRNTDDFYMTVLPGTQMISTWQCSPEHRWFLHDSAPRNTDDFYMTVLTGTQVSC